MPILSAFGALKSFGAQGKAAGYSANFNNASYCGYSAGSIDPELNNFSVELFINQTATPPAASSDVIFDTRFESGIGGMRIAITEALNITATFGNPSGGNITMTSSSTITTGAWYYIAVSRVSGTTRMFIGSSQVASSSSITWSLSFPNNRFGAGIDSLTTNYLNAKLAAFRLNIGSGFSTATVPTGPLSPTAETKILTFQTSSLINEIGGAAPTTNTGVTVSPDDPF